jgi:predicted acylesterase/phospholipase RssA
LAIFLRLLRYTTTTWGNLTMNIVTVFRWIFVYLPKRFTVPLLALAAWYLFYIWPWTLAVFFPTAEVIENKGDIRTRLYDFAREKVNPGWVRTLNLTPAAKAVGVLLVLLVGLLFVYNVAALWYRLTRKWTNNRLFTSWVIVAVLIYAFPWLFSPKDWRPGAGTQFSAFHYVLAVFEGAPQERYRYGILMAIPLLVFLVVLIVAIRDRIHSKDSSGCTVPPTGTEYVRVENKWFDKLLDTKPDLRIGVILAGGGAKGVYQAGAMRAIYEFLSEPRGNEHIKGIDRVRMIAGTSIGSWNSMFWMTGLVKGETPSDPSVLENWWRSADVHRIAQFQTYVPLMQNSFLDTEPWRENFDEIFRQRNLARYLGEHQAQAPDLKRAVGDRLKSLGIRDADGSQESNGAQGGLAGHCPIHFYLTRSNVAQGRLEFATNWDEDVRRRALEGDDITIDSFSEVSSLDSLRDAVFASMDLPPLFPYQQIGCRLYEDGGVVDNLPIRFGNFVEECDLLFVLPLNASFEQEPDRHSVIKRLFRVLDVRQGVLERNSFKLAYLYNHITHLKNIPAVRDHLKSKAAGQKHKEAIKVRGEPVKIFAICPQQPLAVNTAEFWKTDEFKCAFRLMYEATRVELSKFDFTVSATAEEDDPKEQLRMALVSPAGELTYTYRF